MKSIPYWSLRMHGRMAHWTPASGAACIYLLSGSEKTSHHT